MRAIAIAVLITGCFSAIKDDFLDVTPVREVPGLAGKSLAAMDGTRCKSICRTRHQWDSINYCVIATIDAAPRLSCRVRSGGGTAPGSAVDVLVRLPDHVDPRSLPASGSVPNHWCEDAACRSRLPAADQAVIEGCAVYPHRIDATEQFLVCAYVDERAPATM